MQGAELVDDGGRCRGILAQALVPQVQKTIGADPLAGRGDGGGDAANLLDDLLLGGKGAQPFDARRFGRPPLRVPAGPAHPAGQQRAGVVKQIAFDHQEQRLRKRGRYRLQPQRAVQVLEHDRARPRPRTGPPIVAARSASQDRRPRAGRSAGSGERTGTSSRRTRWGRWHRSRRRAATSRWRRGGAADTPLDKRGAAVPPAVPVRDVGHVEPLHHGLIEERAAGSWGAHDQDRRLQRLGHPGRPGVVEAEGAVGKPPGAGAHHGGDSGHVHRRRQ